MQLVSVGSRPQSGAGKRFFNEIGRSHEPGIMIHVSFTDFSSQLLHICAKLFAQLNFARR